MSAIDARPSLQASEATRPTWRRLWPWLLALAGVFVLFSLVPRPAAPSSVLSKGADGLWALRAYLEARGETVTLLDAPLSTDLEARSKVDPPGVLLLAQPWQRLPDPDLERALHRHLRAGGVVILAYAGEESPAQNLLFEILGTTPVVEKRGAPPFGPIAWWHHAKERRTLEPTPVLEKLLGQEPGLAAARLEIPAPDLVPSAPTGARILLTDGDHPVAFDYSLRGGRVLVLPVDLLVNAELAEGGHADLLEALRHRWGGPWRVDEYHHGLIRPELLERSSTAHAWDLFALHLALFYLLGLVALGRRFGPAWRRQRLHTGSTGDFLRSLGVLHDQLGHHRDAAHALLARARRLEPDLAFETELALETAPDTVADGPSLVRFATALAAARGKSPPKAT